MQTTESATRRAHATRATGAQRGRNESAASVRARVSERVSVERASVDRASVRASGVRARVRASVLASLRANVRACVARSGFVRSGFARSGFVRGRSSARAAPVGLLSVTRRPVGVIGVVGVVGRRDCRLVKLRHAHTRQAKVSTGVRSVRSIRTMEAHVQPARQQSGMYTCKRAARPGGQLAHRHLSRLLNTLMCTVADEQSAHASTCVAQTHRQSRKTARGELDTNRVRGEARAAGEAGDVVG